MLVVSSENKRDLGGIALWKVVSKELLKGAAAGRIGMSLAADVTVILVWTLLALGLGCWRTITGDA